MDEGEFRRKVRQITLKKKTSTIFKDKTADLKIKEIANKIHSSQQSGTVKKSCRVGGMNMIHN